MKKIYWAFVLLACSQISFANTETELPEKYKNKAMYLKVEFGGPKLIQNGEKHNAGVLYGNVDELIQAPEEAVTLASKGSFKQKVGLTTGFASLIAGIIAAPATGGASAWAGLAVLYWGLFYSVDGINDIHKALWLHNGHVMNE